MTNPRTISSKKGKLRKNLQDMSGIRFAVPARKGCPCWESGGPAWARLGSEKGWAGLGDVGTPEMLVSLKLRFKKKIHQLSNS